MLRNLLSFLAGALTVTAAVLIGQPTSQRFVFTLGLAAGVLIVGAILWLFRPSFQKTHSPRPARTRQTSPQAIRGPKQPAPAAAPLTAIEADCVAALLNLQMKRPAAIEATKRASTEGHREFQPLFFAAVRSGKAA